MVFWNDKHLINRGAVSPYWLVLDVRKEPHSKLSGRDRFVIDFIDTRGNRDKMTTTQYYLYKKMEILDFESVRHIMYDLVKRVFK